MNVTPDSDTGGSRGRLGAIAVLLMIAVTYLGVAYGLWTDGRASTLGHQAYRSTLSIQAAHDLAMVMEEQRRERADASAACCTYRYRDTEQAAHDLARLMEEQQSERQDRDAAR